MIWGSERGGKPGPLSVWVGYPVSGQSITEKNVDTNIAYEPVEWAETADVEPSEDNKSLICKNTGLYSVSTSLILQNQSMPPEEPLPDVASIFAYISVNGRAMRHQILHKFNVPRDAILFARAVDSRLIQLTSGDALAILVIAMNPPFAVFNAPPAHLDPISRSHLTVARVR